MSHEAAIDQPSEPVARPIPSPSAGSAAGRPHLVAATGEGGSGSPDPHPPPSPRPPPAPLALAKQRRLGLVSAPSACATYEAALAARRERGTPSDGGGSLRWAVARTTPVVDVGVGLGATVAGLAADRR